MLSEQEKAKAIIFGTQVRDFEDLGFDIAARETRTAWVWFCRQMEREEYAEAQQLFFDAYHSDPTT